MSKKNVIDSVHLKEFEVFIWLGPITMVIVYKVTMTMLYTYHFPYIDPVLWILKSTQFLNYWLLVRTQYPTGQQAATNFPG